MLGSVVVTVGRGLRVVGAVGGTLLVLAAAGTIGPVLVDGYADALWVLAAAGAVGYGLVAGPGTGRLGLAGLLVLVAGFTKLEGIATVALVVVLVAVRHVVSVPPGGGAGRSGRRRKATVAWAGGALAGLAVLAAWPVLTGVLHAYPDVDTSGRRVGTVGSRLDASLDAVWPHLHLVVAAAVVAALGTLALAGRRRSLGLAGDGWLWGVLAWNLVVVLSTYGLGSVAVDAWLATSVDRTTIFAPVLACTSMATWAVVAASALAARPGASRRRRWTVRRWTTGPGAYYTTSHDHLRPPLRPHLRGVRDRGRLPALAGQDDHRGRRPPVLHAHHEPPPPPHQQRGSPRTRRCRGRTSWSATWCTRWPSA